MDFTQVSPILQIFDTQGNGIFGKTPTLQLLTRENDEYSNLKVSSLFIILDY